MEVYKKIFIAVLPTFCHNLKALINFLRKPERLDVEISV